MAYNEQIANRIREALAHLPNVKEKKMFGGLAFMVNDKMCITVGADTIMCRIDPAIHESAISRNDCRTVIMGGREYKGYVDVGDNGIRSKKDFDYWIEQALDYNKIAKASKKK